MLNWLPAAQLESAASNLDDVETTPVYYFDKKRVLREFPGRTGLLDSNENPIDIVSNNYNILPHRALVRVLVRALEELELTGTALAALEEDGPVLKVTVLFPGHEVPGTRYTLGFTLANSYDLSKACRTDLVLWNSAAMRRIVLSLVGPSLQLFHKGLTEERLEQGLLDYIPRLLGPDTATEVSALIASASTDIITLPTVEQKRALLRVVVSAQAHLEPVVRTVPDRVSRWDLFAAVANYTDTPAVSAIVRDKYNSLAERKILFAQLPVPTEGEAAVLEGETQA